MPPEGLRKSKYDFQSRGWDFRLLHSSFVGPARPSFGAIIQNHAKPEYVNQLDLHNMPITESSFSTGIWRVCFIFWPKEIPTGKKSLQSQKLSQVKCSRIRWLTQLNVRPETLCNPHHTPRFIVFRSAFFIQCSCNLSRREKAFNTVTAGNTIVSLQRQCSKPLPTFQMSRKSALPVLIRDLINAPEIP